MADTKLIDWGDGSGEKITVTASSFVGNKGLQIQSPENVKVTPRSKTIVLKSKTDPTKVARINVTQEKAVYTYDFTLTASVPTIAAKGGSSIVSAQLKTYRNGNLIETKTVTPVLSGTGTGFSISGTTVSASNRTTVVGSERSIPVTGKFSGTFDGQEVSATVVVKQEANSQSLREITNRYTSSNPYTGQNTVKANGGTVWVYTFAIYDYTSGSTSESNVSDECTFGNVTFGTWDSEKHTWTCPTAGTTIYSEDRGASIQVKWGSKSTVYYLYQQANSLTWNNPVITYAYSDIAASGGTVTPSLSITQSGSYTSGSTASNTTIGSKTFTGTGVNTSTGAYTASSLGTTVKARTKLSTGTVTVTANGKSASKAADIYQAENKIERYNYGDWNIVISANPTTIAYGGGTSTISTSCTRSKTPVYSSGATGSVGSESTTPTLSGSATGFTLSGTTVTASANSWAATRSITVTASYSGATSKSVTITQSAAPASISLNKTIIAFPQRASSNNVQVTCNSDWSVNSNDEFAVPETLQIKYNPSTDMVEIVDQPSQIIKKVQESDDYVLALVRIGAHQSAKNHSATETISRENIRDAKNAAGYRNRNQMFLLSKQQDKSYHRIVPRQWFRNGDALSQIRLGASGGRGADGITPQAALFSLATLISKPGVKLGIRGCELSVPLVHVAEEEFGYVRPVNSVTWNKETGRLTLVCQDRPNADSVAQPRLTMVSCTSNNGPLGYILFKKKSTYDYLDVHGWEEISNFTLARILSNREFKVKQVGSTFEVIVTFQYGEV